MNPQINTIDFNQRPFIAIWEVTQACDLTCVHCRASAQPDRHPIELSTDEGKRLIDQIAALKVPVRGSFSSLTPEKYFRADFCRCRRATSATSHWTRFTANRLSSGV
jgi:hypothetical protein